MWAVCVVCAVLCCVCVALSVCVCELVCVVCAVCCATVLPIRPERAVDVLCYLLPVSHLSPYSRHCSGKGDQGNRVRAHSLIDLSGCV